jgi:putative endonuclease
MSAKTLFFGAIRGEPSPLVVEICLETGKQNPVNPTLPAMASWHVYLVQCRDDSLYCGIASDLQRRIAQHNAGNGAKYIVPSRRPVTCVWKRRARNQGDALRLEYWLKGREASVKRSLSKGEVELRRSAAEGWRLVNRTEGKAGMRSRPPKKSP